MSMTQTWSDILGLEKKQAYFQHILQTVSEERQSGQIIFPPQKDVFNAFRYTDFNQVKVIILGQDPYHGVGQAHGLAFSVQKNIDVPPSLRNIYKELADDITDFRIPQHGCLQQWTEEGVLLLNTVLTVRAHQAHSHKELGWEIFTDKVIEQLNQYGNNLVFLLWGGPAQKKGAKIDRNRHLVLSTSHPSPLSAYRGFLGCKHFSKTNQYLIERNIEPINWQIE